MSINTTTYLIKLTPYSEFFFGKEQNPEKPDYYLKSNYFPQQTGLLGLVRHQLLIWNNLLDEYGGGVIKDKKNAKQLIGEKSFDAGDNSKTSNQFGVINSLSPCFVITEDGVKYIPWCHDFALELELREGQTNLQPDVQKGFIPFLPKFDHKEYYPEVLSNGTHSESISSFFETSERPGINKNYQGKTELNAYYKQQWLRFASRKYSFGFYLTVRNEVRYRNSPIAVQFRASENVFLGKERSAFKWSATKQEIDLPKDEKDPNAIVLLSDAYAAESILGKSEFAITDTINFRNFINRVDQDKNSYYNKRAVQSNSRSLLLLKRGSILYHRSELSEIEKCFKHPHFIKIGYNHYVKIKTRIT